jgi:hypothetical protein
MMDEFIQMVTRQLGVSDETGRSATGGILKMIQDQIGRDLFAKVQEQLPGVQGLIGAAEKSNAAETGGGGGLMGSLTSIAGSLLGGKAKGYADIISALTKSGLSPEKIPQYLSLLVGFLKEKLGSDLFAKVVAKLPELLGQK